MCKIVTGTAHGYEVTLVGIDVDLRRGIPAVDIVGLSDGQVKETRERVRSAIGNSGLEFPPERVLVSLSPADLYKSGEQFNLAVALGIVAEAEQGKDEADEVRVFAFGELDPSGDIRPCRGLYAMLQTAVREGVRYAIVPEQTETLPDGICVKKVKSLLEAVEALHEIQAKPAPTAEEWDNGFGKTCINGDVAVEFTDTDSSPTFDEVKGLDGLKYAMTVAVAGGHHLLAYGSAGCGKTLMLQHLPDLMPRLLPNEKADVNRIYSLAGLAPKGKAVVERPFRMPHQTASIEGMFGGGQRLTPGEVTLAHDGVLFLDEAAEFKSSVLQMLRVPLESRVMTLSRAGRSTVFPSSFQLVMATNPCPCGNYGSKDKPCLCSRQAVTQYWKKFSMPLLDRIAIVYDCGHALEVEGRTLAEYRQMIATAWKAQYARQGKLNNTLDPAEVASIKMTDGAEAILQRIQERDGLSPRGEANLRKLARTLADIDGSETVTEGHAKMADRLYGKIPVTLE